MGKVNEYDTVQAQEMLSSVFGAEYARSETNVQAVARFMATHRQAAEKTQQERDAALIEAMGNAEEDNFAGLFALKACDAIRSQGHE